MKIIVGSTNPQKITAVQDVTAHYDFLSGADIEGFSADSGVSDQPKSIDETVQGAINRAKHAFLQGCDYSFGIESGLIKVPHTQFGIMELCAVAIFDGTDIRIGLSSAFEPPQKIVELMEEGMNMQDACFHSGITDNPNIGSAGGLIGILTRDRLDRLAYTKQAVTMALIHVENKGLF
jgi:inosine/xanthosine triphosphatase